MHAVPPPAWGWAEAEWDKHCNSSKNKQTKKKTQTRTTTSQLHELKSKTASRCNLAVITGVLTARNAQHEIKIPIPTEGNSAGTGSQQGCAQPPAGSSHSSVTITSSNHNCLLSKKKKKGTAAHLVNLTVLEKKTDNLIACLCCILHVTLL